MLAQIFIGVALVVATVLVHAITLELILKAFLAVRRDVLARWRTLVFSLVIMGVLVSHLIEASIWAVYYYVNPAITEIPTMEAALYFSISCFTTVGFGDVVLSEDWRLLSSIESINGMIFFGWSTAFIFEIVRLIYVQIYPDDRETSVA